MNPDLKHMLAKKFGWDCTKCFLGCGFWHIYFYVLFDEDDCDGICLYILQDGSFGGQWFRNLNSCEVFYKRLYPNAFQWFKYGTTGYFELMVWVLYSTGFSCIEAQRSPTRISQSKEQDVSGSAKLLLKCWAFW